MRNHGRLIGLIVLLLASTATSWAKSPNEVLFNKLAVRAAAGMANAQYNLGMLYNNGIGTPENPKLAFQWFEKAAAGGDPLGSYKVGCYYAGQFHVVPPDGDKSLRFKLVAAKAGYVLAQHDVAIDYLTHGDFVDAAKWWQRAAQQGDVLALVVLGKAYKFGRGVPQNAAKSYAYLLKATKLVPKQQARQIKPLLDEQRKAIGLVAATQAEKVAAAWTPQPSALTKRAREGINEARRIAQ